MAADCRTPPFLQEDLAEYGHCVRKRTAIMLAVVTVILVALGAGGLAHINRTVSDPDKRRSERQRVLRNLCIALGAGALLCLIIAPEMLRSAAGMQRKRYQTLVQQGVPPHEAAARVQRTSDGITWLLILFPFATR